MINSNISSPSSKSFSFWNVENQLFQDSILNNPENPGLYKERNKKIKVGKQTLSEIFSAMQ